MGEDKYKLDITGGNYITPPTQVSALSRAFPSLAFYGRLAGIVVASSRDARAGRYDTERWRRSSLAVIRALEAVGVRFNVTGLDNLARFEGPAVIVANHMSTLETFILPCIIQPHRNITFVIKGGLLKYPVFKHIMKSRNPIVVGRVNPREDFKKVMKEGKQRLEQGTSVVIFPQTTRSDYLDEKKFNSIGIKLAKNAKVPVIPIALKTDAWGVGRFVKDLGEIDPSRKVTFSFGAPIYISGNGKSEHKQVIDFISGKLDSWQD